ncbi:MAG: YjfI family protein [Saezia sp.]
MNNKTSAYYQRLYRQRLRDQGLVKKEVWILPEHTAELNRIENQLRQHKPEIQAIENVAPSAAASQPWAITALLIALSSTPLFAGKQASIELLQGSEPSIYIEVHKHGDLPIFIAISGDQIIIESMLCSKDDIDDLNAFNRAVLKTHKLFPLSSIALETQLNGESYYVMYGALSAMSQLSDITLEIDILTDNIIKATEMYKDFLKEKRVA